MTQKPEHRYEVHTYTLCDGWINCWTITDENNAERPDSYTTTEAAQVEIDELLADVQAEIDSGERKPDEGYDSGDYRIFDNVKNEYQTG